MYLKRHLNFGRHIDEITELRTEEASETTQARELNVLVLVVVRFVYK